MEVSNITLAAYMDTLKDYGHDPSLLVSGTSLSWNDALNPRKKHSWNDFITMTDYLFKTVGEADVLKSIVSTGVQNKELSTIRKISSAVMSPEAAYWFFCNFISKYMYKNITFKYKKIERGIVDITVQIKSGDKRSENFIKAYATSFEGFMSPLGLPRSISSYKVNEENTVIRLLLPKSVSLWSPYKLLKRFVIGIRYTSKLLNEIESSAHQHKLLNKKLLNTNNELDKSKLLHEALANAVMHDMSNPLSLTILKVDKLFNSKSSFTSKDTEILKRSTDSMRNIIENLRQFHLSKEIESKDIIDFSHAYLEVRAIFQKQLEEKKISLHYTPCHTEADKVLGNQSIFTISILSNFISNSIKYSFENSSINVTTRIFEKTLVLTIMDKGTGMTPQKLSCFTHISPTTSEKGTNSELGLGIGHSQAIYFLNKMNGSMTVQSKLKDEKSFDHGTVIELSFPIIASPRVLH